MTPATIIQKAAADGVGIALSTAGAIKATGEAEAVHRWLPVIREQKPEIIAELQQAASDPGAVAESTIMGAIEEASILDWLRRIGESDLVTIGEVIDRCRADAEVRAYFLGLAADNLRDDQFTRDECANFVARQCQ